MTHIARWIPEDDGFWLGVGRSVARRNLWLSAPALVLAFAVWMLWSAVVVHLPAAGFPYSTNQLFWLAALPALSGATLRLFYAFAVPFVGGRRFTALATASLLLPALGTGFAVQDPGTPFEVMVLLSLLCGLGGGNFASSMANVGFFYPAARQGAALGLNADLGHLGVPLVQWLVPVVAGWAFVAPLVGSPQGAGPGTLWLQNAGFVWVPLIAASAVAAWFGMDDLAEARASFAEQAVIFTRRHNWFMCWLQAGTLGSFIGCTAAFPLLLLTQFELADALQFAWLGPLLGALARPIGSRLAARVGAARVTFWCFAAMALGALAALASLPGAGQAAQLGGFVAGFALLFAASGLGHGSSFRMISTIFPAERLRAAGLDPDARAQALREGQVEAAAVLGFASAVGAYGGFFIPKSCGSAIALTGSAAPALWAVIAFYMSCMALTWWQYSRRHAPMPC